MTSDVTQAARGHWPHILTSLGVAEKHLGINKPCPTCENTTDAFSFTDKGAGLFYCRKHGGGDGFRLLEQLYGWSFKQTLSEVQRVLGSAPAAKPFKPARDPSEYLNRVWGQTRCVALRGPVHRYLLSRGLDALPDVREALGLTVAGKTYAAMVATLVDVKNKPVTLHLTYLENNEKAALEVNKRILPPKGGAGATKGTVARLWKATDEVVLTEGIESACAAHQLTGVPAWACISANGLESVKLPESITRVLVYGDNDSHKSFAGEKAAYVLAARLTREGRQVEVHLPDKGDWLDYLNTQQRKVA